jgi:hypothetical protein
MRRPSAVGFDLSAPAPGVPPARVSQQAWNGIRAAIWQHLRVRPDDVAEFGEQALSQRLGRFLDRRNGQFGAGASLLYSPRELNVMGQLAVHYGKMVPDPRAGIVNHSNSANVGRRLVSKGADIFARHIGGILGMGIMGGGLGAHAAGWAIGQGIQRRIEKGMDARRLEAARDLFLGNRVMPELNPNYERAAAILGHAARPLSLGGP